jgi:hypothetical protein
MYEYYKTNFKACDGWSSLCTPKELFILQWTNSTISQYPMPGLEMPPTQNILDWKDELAKFNTSISTLILF